MSMLKTVPLTNSWALADLRRGAGSSETPCGAAVACRPLGHAAEIHAPDCPFNQ